MAIGKPVLAPPQMDIGWTFLGVVALCTAAYLGGGIALAKSPNAAPTRSSSWLSMMRLHPHYARWIEAQGLVADGLAFARGTASNSERWKNNIVQTGGQRAGKGYGAVVANDDEAHEEHQRNKRSMSSKHKKKITTQQVGVGKAAASSRKMKKKEKDAAQAALLPAVSGTASGGGGRWVHVPN